MKNKNISAENYLDKIPLRHPDIDWTSDNDGVITLHIENKGAMNRLAQKLFNKPKVSHVHMEEIGSFIWPHLNGERNIFELGELVKEHFGDAAEPLYERLAQYFHILESYNFIIWK